MRYEVFGVSGIPEVRENDDIAQLIVTALSAAGDSLHDGDVVIVTSKIVSKAEGRVVEGDDREAAIDAEAVRTVAEWTTPRGRTRVVETKHGLVLAAAGVDASNVESGHVVLLPVDPDASARVLRAGIAAATGANVAVIVTDTVGRAWRQGVTDIAIGSAGIQVLDDLRGQVDEFGNELGVTMVAVADEIAAASELVRGKLHGVPVAVVRGLGDAVLPRGTDDHHNASAAALVRPSTEDRFRLGTPEAMRAAVLTRTDVADFTGEPVDDQVVNTAIAAALTGPAVGARPDLRFVLVRSDTARGATATSLAATDPKSADIVANAPGLVAVFLAGGSPEDFSADPGTPDPEDSSADPGTPAILAAAAAVENLLIALAAEGVGSTWLNIVDRRDIDVPADWRPFAVIAYGRTTQPLRPRSAPDPGHRISTV